MEQPNLKSGGKSFLVTFLGFRITAGWTPSRTPSRTEGGGTTCPFQHLMLSLKPLLSFLECHIDREKEKERDFDGWFGI